MFAIHTPRNDFCTCFHFVIFRIFKLGYIVPWLDPPWTDNHEPTNY